MRMFSLFSGIGAFEKALDTLGIPYELVGYCEIDKYASKSYSAIHDVPETMNFGDITKIDEKALPKDIDLITYGFPCQDISLAGKQKGLFNEDGTQTRSGLFFEALRIIEETQPKVAIAENVKNLVGKKFNAQFQVVLASLEAAGYNNYWKVLNAKDYGIPQNRERVFIVSIRKDIDTGSFEFPEGFPLELRLKDMLEEVVDEKFYLSENMVNYFIKNTKKQQEKGNGFKFEPTNGDVIAKAITTRAGGRMDDNFIEVYDLYNGNQIDPNVCGTITTGCSRNASGTFLVREATKKGYAEAVEGDAINLEQPNSKTRRGRVGHGVAQTLTTSPQQGVVVCVDDKVEPINPMPDGTCRTIKNQYAQTAIANTVRTGSMGATMVGEKLPDDVPQNEKEQVYKVKNHTVNFIGRNQIEVEYPMNLPNGTFKIRKLTPKECFRLMGFTDEDFAKAEAVNSNTQLYKQAGNSIVVDVIAHIFTRLIKEM